jgi:hypothetical protein
MGSSTSQATIECIAEIRSDNGANHDGKTSKQIRKKKKEEKKETLRQDKEKAKSKHESINCPYHKPVLNTN